VTTTGDGIVATFEASTCAVRAAIAIEAAARRLGRPHGRVTPRLRAPRLLPAARRAAEWDVFSASGPS